MPSKNPKAKFQSGNSSSSSNLIPTPHPYAILQPNNLNMYCHLVVRGGIAPNPVAASLSQRNLILSHSLLQGVGPGDVAVVSKQCPIDSSLQALVPGEVI